MTAKKNTRIQVSSFFDDQTCGECIYKPSDLSVQFALQIDEEIKYQSQHTKDDREYVPTGQLLSLVRNKTIKLPSEVEDYGSAPELLSNVRSYIHKYVDLSESFEIICAYYVVLTWLYDKFNELPYLRVRGDYGSGKTRFLSVIGSICYKPIFASGASTTAPLFHLLNDIQGTLILDESDFRYSDTTAELTKILNNGNMKGFSVLRCEQTNSGKFTATAYSIFGPKIVAARESFKDDALESRFITEDLGAKPLRGDIPVSLPDAFEQESLALRNKLLQYRFDHLKKPISTHVLDIPGLAGRTQQIYQPLLSLIEDHNELSTVYMRITAYESQLRSDRGLQTEAELLQVIHQMELHEKELSIAEITKNFVIQFGSRYGRRITPKWIGHLIRSRLHLATRKAHGVYIISEGQSEKLNRLMQTYDVL